jgi:protein-S-isoprenylcysteine O-methyltransferase Ste14
MPSGLQKPRIYPPIWLVIALASMFALDRWLPLMVSDVSLPRPLPWAVMACGLAVVLSAWLGFQRAKTGIVPFSESTKLVTGGMYRITRNPMYLGMALVLAGVALKLGSFGAWIPIPCCAHHPPPVHSQRGGFHPHLWR